MSVALSPIEKSLPTLADYFWENVRACGHQPALQLRTDGGWRELTWAEVAAAVSWWIDRLGEQGPDGNWSVATCLPNGLDWLAIDIACQTLGGLHVAIDPRESPSRKEQMLRGSGAAACVDQPWGSLNEMLASPLACGQHFLQTRRGDTPQPALLLSTSGTSGEPKLVALSHHNLLSNALAKLEAAPQYSWDQRLNVLPFSHAYARTCELSTWLLTRSRLAIAESWGQVLEGAAVLRPTLINLVPHLAEQLVQALNRDRRALGDRLRLIQVGGAGLRDDTWHALNELGLPPLQGYGLTEASPVVCSNRAGTQRSGTVGPPVRGVEVRIDASGELWTRGPHVMLGYWRDPLATSTVVQDGWLRTGDLVDRGPDGLRVVGRTTQQIVLSTGYKISPEQIEAAVSQESWIERVFVTGTGRAYPVAVVWLDWSKLPNHLASCRPQRRHAAVDDELSQTLRNVFQERLSALPRYAIPTKIHTVASQAADVGPLLSRKGTWLRAAVQARFAAEIEQLYA